MKSNLTKLGFTKHSGIKKHLRYGNYLVRHKANIISPMLQLDLSLGQALKHDISKFAPKEWGPYAEWMEGDTGRYSLRAPETFYKWRKAVRHHYRHNPHHYRMYSHPEDIPLKYKLEALADWYSVNKTKSQIKGNKIFPDFRHWYAHKYYKLPLEPTARKFVDTRLNVVPLEYLQFIQDLKRKQDAARNQI